MHIRKANSALKKYPIKIHVLIYVEKKTFKDIFQILNMFYLLWRAGCGGSGRREEQWREGVVHRIRFIWKASKQHTHIYNFPSFQNFMYLRKPEGNLGFYVLSYRDIQNIHSNFRKMLQSNIYNILLF